MNHQAGDTPESNSEKQESFMEFGIDNLKKIALLQDNGGILEIFPKGITICKRVVVTKRVKATETEIELHRVFQSDLYHLTINISGTNYIKPSEAVQKRITARIKANKKAQKIQERKAAKQAAKGHLRYDQELDYDIWA